MAIPLKTITQMNSDSLRYLAKNTDITYLAEGSIAKALVETTNREIARVGEYMAAVQSNTFLDSASGPYLDVIGEMFGLRRISDIKASTSVSDRNVKFSTNIGQLGDSFPDPANKNQGVIPAGLEISTIDGTITYYTSEKTYFERARKEVFVAVKAKNSGDEQNIGRNKLITHTGPYNVTVTNEQPIANGLTRETDSNFRFRISNNLVATPTGNETAIRLSIAGNPDIVDIKLNEFARGAGTFDALLVPAGNTVSKKTLNTVQIGIEQSAAFGINGRAIEPNYMKFKISLRLIPADGSSLGVVDTNKLNTKNAILDYFETVPLGGELIINRLRSAIIGATDSNIKDIRILEICLNDRPHMIRNIKLKPDEVFTPDMTSIHSAIEII